MNCATTSTISTAFSGPIRSYFYWERHCFDIPVCRSMRSLCDALDGIDELSEQISGLSGDFDRMDQLMPKLLADFPATIDSTETMLNFLLSNHSTMTGIQAHMQEGAEGSTLMGQYFDEAKNDNSFYLPEDRHHLRHGRLAPGGHRGRPDIP